MFFFFLTGIHTILSILLIVALTRAVKRVRSGGAGISHLRYAAPVLLSVLTILHLMWFTAPYLLDSLRVMNGTYEVATMTIERTFGPWVKTDLEGWMIHDPFMPGPQRGTQYQMTYLSRSGFIRDLTVLR